MTTENRTEKKKNEKKKEVIADVSSAETGF